MKPLLRITPLHKKSVEMTYEIYAVEGNDPPRSWIVTEQYRAGRGFMELEDFDLDLFDSDSVICSTKFSEDPQFGDNHGNLFEFSDGFVATEKERIMQDWIYGDENLNSGVGWIDTAIDKWAIDDEYLEIFAPLKMDLVDGLTYSVLQEDLGREDLQSLLINEHSSTSTDR